MARAMTGAEMVIKALADQGVEHIFGYPGGAVLPIYDELFQQEKVKHILVRQEGEMEVLKPGQDHAEPEFAMTPCIPARDRHRLDVGLPDLIGPRETAQVALHEG